MTNENKTMQNIKEYATANGIIRYCDINEQKQPTILFIHGLGCCGSMDYITVATDSSLAQHRCLVVDLLGSGLSDKPIDFSYTLHNQAQLLADFINDLATDKLVIYGHSMGGTIAILLAEMITDKVQHLILSEANLDSGGGEFSRKIANATQEEFCQYQFAQIVKECSQSNNSNDIKWSISLEKTLPKAFYEEAKALVIGQEKSWRQIFYELPIAKTYIFGEKSLPYNDVQNLPQHSIDVEIISDVGHSMAWENPHSLADTLGKILDR